MDPNGVVLAVVPSTRELVFQQLGRHVAFSDSYVSPACMLTPHRLQRYALLQELPSLARSRPGWQSVQTVPSGW